MPVMLVWTRLPAIIAASMALAVGAIDATPVESTRVEVWIVGDDGLTLRLRDALESAFRSSPDFTLSSGKKPGTLVVTIPTNVKWKKAGRITVHYTVKFSSIDDQSLGASSGSCWENALTKCTAQIVRDAKSAAREIIRYQPQSDS